MRFRTKLFAAWGILVLALYASSVLPVHQTISSSFNRIALDGFAGTKQNLHDFQAEQVLRLRQECALVMNIPDLRSLIAENSAELKDTNLASLEERLDTLSTVVGVPAMFILDGRGRLIAQNSRSPWTTLQQLQNYLAESPQARALATRLYRSVPATDADIDGSRVESGVWSANGQIYQVVGLPLTFQANDPGSPPDVEGALIMATPLTDKIAGDLARSHNCSVSFVSGGTVVSSSLSTPARAELSNLLRQKGPSLAADFDLQLSGVAYRSSFEPLIDPSSRQQVGGTLIQSSLQEAAAVQSALWRNLAIIGLAGLAVAAFTSFLLSATVTRPVQSLLKGVRRVSQGDLDVVINTQAGGELGELSRAFTDMVEQLRSRRQLERLVEESRAASQAKSQFLAHMSHEIRTPLNGVIGMADLLQKTPLNPRQERFVGLLQTSGRVLMNVINDILDFSKIEAGKLEIESVEFNLRQMLLEVVELLESKAHAKKLYLQSNVSADLSDRWRGDAKRLQQILMNLVNNAIKFTESGGISLHAAEVQGENNACHVRFEVRDTGIGIPPDRMSRLFQSFSQVDASTTRKYGGTGLGLAICKQLAELMGGQIGVTSDAGHGSTFWFTVRLQLPTSPTPANAVPTAQTNAITRSVRVLVADDNEVNQIVVSEALRAAGHTCEIVNNGRQVLDAVAKSDYDLILMDCQMPEMDGFEATRQIRLREQAAAQKGAPSRHIPIIALTASAVQGDRDLCITSGMDDYVSKPIDFPKLTAAIARHMSQQPAVAAAPAPPIPPAEPTPKPINVLRLLERYAATPQLVPTLLDRFERQIASDCAALESTLAKSEIEAFTAIVHSIKGSAGYLSAEKMSRLAAQLENGGRNKDLDALRTGMDELHREIDACLRQIPEVRQRVKAPDTAAK